MKRTILSLQSAVVFFLSLLLIFQEGCSKSDPVPSIQRLTCAFDGTRENYALKTEYIYAGSLLTTIITTGRDSIERSRTVFHYSGDRVSDAEFRENLHGKWLLLYLYEISSYSGNNPGEIIMHSFDYNGNEQQATRYLYTYHGSRLEQYSVYDLVGDRWDIRACFQFSYNAEDRLVRDTDTLDPVNFTTYYYDGDRLAESLLQSYDSQNQVINRSKSVYSYTEGNVDKIAAYGYWANSWNSTPYFVQNFSYNNSGNLVRYFNNNSCLPTMMEYQYEDGKAGNYRACMKLLNQWPSLPDIPDPRPVRPGREPVSSLIPLPE